MSARAIHKELQQLSVTKEVVEPYIDIEWFAKTVDLPLHLVMEYLQILAQLEFVIVNSKKVKLTPAGKNARVD